ncbi:MAG TPA: HD domain-containing protein [Spirochaetota bacterium]|nr:HD domain-containing protein [Spirochaetota bacterium]
MSNQKTNNASSIEKLYQDLKGKYIILYKKFNYVILAFKKSRLAFRRLLKNYIIVKKKYIYLQKNSNQKVMNLIDKINEEKYQIIFDHNKRLISVSENFLNEIEMDKKEFASSFYIDILFEKYLPKTVNGVNQIEIKEFQFPILIKNYMFDEDNHIHPYIYFMMTGKLQFDAKTKKYYYLLSAENISASVELKYFQKTDNLITELSYTNYNLMKAKKTIEMHKVMVISLTCSLVEEYNKETSLHLEKIRTLTNYLGSECERMGLIKIEGYDIEDFVKDITYTSVLHDIGKMGIPNEILSKEDVLTDEEKSIVRSHTQIGANYIRKIIDSFKEDASFSLYINFLKIPYNICLYHHERWDGKGYPCGLKENFIPIEARIVSVADTYDAIRAHRIYSHSKRSHQEVVDIIKSEAGKQFDPKIVEAFLNVCDKFEQVEYDKAEGIKMIVY